MEEQNPPLRFLKFLAVEQLIFSILKPTCFPREQRHEEQKWNSENDQRHHNFHSQRTHNNTEGAWGSKLLRCLVETSSTRICIRISLPEIVDISRP